VTPLSWFRKPSSHDELQGKKVYLRAPEAADFEEWAHLRQQSRDFLEPWEPSWSADEFSRMAFRLRVKIYQQRARDDEAHTYFLFDQMSGRLVGGLSISHIRRGVSQAGTLGYWVGEPFTRQGYMKDAIRALLVAAKPVFGLHRLEAACLPRNVASSGLLLKCGFAQEGFAKAYVKIAGQWEDHLLFGRIVD
jgi:ribosomal-protein-alanine N-acetyltransferase